MLSGSPGQKQLMQEKKKNETCGFWWRKKIKGLRVFVLLFYMNEAFEVWTQQQQPWQITEGVWSRKGTA